MDIQSLRLNQERILQKLSVVDQERKFNYIEGDQSEKTAIDYLNALGVAVDTFPLVELLNKMGVGLQIYNEHTKEMETWLLGLAPDFPKGKRELRFDWWPDHEIRRYFRLPDTRACFIPGYFLRLFVNMVNNKSYELREGYGNAAKMSKTFINDDNWSNCEVQIILCQMSDKDQDAFIVSVAGKGEQAMHHAFRELNVLRSFIYADSWGLNFHEFCLPVWHVDDQKRLSRVREDFLDEKKALDEVEPYIFGIPQMVERDSFDRAEASASSVHEDCMAARREWSRWYFGDKPDMEEVLRWEGLNNDEKFQEGILRLRRGAQYEPSTFALEKQVDFEANSTLSSCLTRTKRLHLNVDGETLPFHLSDIYQCYSEACYDFTTLFKPNNFPNRLKNASHAHTEVDYSTNELSLREVVYRSMKLWFHKCPDKTDFLVQQEDATKLVGFDKCIESMHPEYTTSTVPTNLLEVPTDSICAYSSVLLSKLKHLHYTRKRARLQHHIKLLKLTEFTPTKDLLKTAENCRTALRSIDDALKILDLLTESLPESIESVDLRSNENPFVNQTFRRNELEKSIEVELDSLKSLNDELYNLNNRTIFVIEPSLYLSKQQCRASKMALQKAKKRLIGVSIEVQNEFQTPMMCGKCIQELVEHPAGTWDDGWTCDWSGHSGGNYFTRLDKVFGCRTIWRNHIRTGCNWGVCENCYFFG
jgi:hypothetical protein